MKKTAFAFLLSLAWSLGFSQNRAHEIDSLRHELSIGVQDTSRVLTMTGLANAYKFYKPDSSLYYAQQALALARQIKYPKGEFQALFMMGFTLGVVGNYTRALEIELKALRIAEKNNFLRGKAEVFNRLGVIYRDAGDYSKAIVFHQRARMLFDSIHEYDMSATSQNLLSRIYFVTNQPDSAQHYIQMAYDNINRWKVDWLRSPNLLGMGKQQAKSGNYGLALDYFRQSIPHAQVYQEYLYTAQAYFEIARVYQQTNQPDSCVFYAQKALADAQKGNIYNEIVNASLFLSSLYEQKNTPLALQHQKTAFAAKAASSISAT